MLRAYVAHLRTTTADGTPPSSRKERAQALSPRALRWLLSRKREDLKREEQTRLDQLLGLSPQVETLYTLLQAFLKMVSQAFEPNGFAVDRAEGRAHGCAKSRNSGDVLGARPVAPFLTAAAQ